MENQGMLVRFPARESIICHL